MYDNEHFQELQQSYKSTQSKESWEMLWLYVQDVLSNSLKKKLKGVYRSDYEDMLIEGTISIMSRYKKSEDYNIQYLPALTALVSRNLVYNKKQQREDREVSYEGLYCI